MDGLFHETWLLTSLGVRARHIKRATGRTVISCWKSHLQIMLEGSSCERASHCNMTTRKIATGLTARHVDVTNGLLLYL